MTNTVSIEKKGSRVTHTVSGLIFASISHAINKPSQSDRKIYQFNFVVIPMIKAIQDYFTSMLYTVSC